MIEIYNQGLTQVMSVMKELTNEIKSLNSQVETLSKDNKALSDRIKSLKHQIKKMLEYLREGDTLYIESISKLARSIKDFLAITQELQGKKVELVSLKENIDTITPQDRFALTIFAALAELEREF